MLAVGGRILAYIDGYIQYRSFDYSHQFGLAEWFLLEMQSPHHAIAGVAFIVLYESGAAYFFFKFALRERLEEISSGILENARLYNGQSFYLCLDDIHVILRLFWAKVMNIFEKNVFFRKIYLSLFIK
jgi:hypothetical protein